MMETRSAVYKMMKNTAHEERQITKWQPPFLSDATPYVKRDFDIHVREVCLSKQSISIPKISKAIILGDVAVGKTSLVNRFCHKHFDNNYKATIGVDFEVERFDILGIPYNLQIWDTAGQERFKCIAASYYRGANVIVIVFDLGSLMSLSHCRQWLDEAQRSNNGTAQLFLVGSKRDLLSNSVYEVIERRAVSVARSMRAEFWAVSARTGDGISELFSRIAALSFNALLLQEVQSIRKVCTIGNSDLVTLKSTPDNIPKKKNKPRCSGSCLSQS
ncbi:ras-related protein Rab-34 isoform X2 [Athalia rosae]|uniref:ras-related protein Rab-34 isoform X2 n=1 Tax=Athalia rosae TaxID=37344 RepID=UPI00203360F3|nr:ras-related protein Rab-34 isoform X2 [Athalia rosae]